jgi:hypothetical protein
MLSQYTPPCTSALYRYYIIILYYYTILITFSNIIRTLIFYLLSAENTFDGAILQRTQIQTVAVDFKTYRAVYTYYIIVFNNNNNNTINICSYCVL